MSAKVYEAVTKKLIERIESDGLLPWQRPWRLEDQAQNFVSRKPYKGINVFTLMDCGFVSNFWLTFKQAKELGGVVKKGEKSSPVIFWRFPKKEEKEGTTDEKKAKTFFSPMYHQVFNLEQTEGIEYEKPVKRVQNPRVEPAHKAVDLYMSSNGITLEHGGSQAFYSPSRDLIKLPDADNFETVSAYLMTMFHEAAHSTGIKKRLDRGLDTETTHFGSERYSKEELVAEFGASFMAAQFDLFAEHHERNSAAYLKSWVAKIKANPAVLIFAAGQAQKAVDFILGKGKEVEQQLVEAES